MVLKYLIKKRYITKRISGVSGDEEVLLEFDRIYLLRDRSYIRLGGVKIIRKKGADLIEMVDKDRFRFKESIPKLVNYFLAVPETLDNLGDLGRNEAILLFELGEKL